MVYDPTNDVCVAQIPSRFSGPMQAFLYRFDPASASYRQARTVPCEVLAVNKWWDDGTLRWVHLIFQSDCPANGKALVTPAGARTW